jgi:aminopeptidase N
VVTALGQFRRSDVARLLGRIARDDASVLVAASACRALGATRQSSAFAELSKLIERPSWADVLRSGAIDGLAELRDERAVDALREQTRYGVPTRGRRAAVVALAKLTTSRAVREHIEQLLDAETPLLRVAAVEALAEMGDAKSRPPLARRLERELDGRVRRRIREALRDLGAKGRNELRRLRDEIDELRRAHDELRVRLGKLEARPEPAARARRRRGRRPARA